MDEPRENCVSRRSAILFAVLALWALAALVRGFWLAGPASGHYIREGEKQARSYGRIPAPRGRILDSRGVPLAWSERYFDLFWQGRAGEVPGEEILIQLRAIVPDAAAPSAESNGRELLRRGLSPDQIRQLESLVKSGNGFRIVPRWERITVSSRWIRRRVGAVELRGGELVGVSGLELEFDALLRGRAGEFRVLLDRYRNWIPESWELLRPPEPGRDIKLNFEAEMLERHGRGNE